MDKYLVKNQTHYELNSLMCDWQKYVIDQKIEQKKGYYIMNDKIIKNMKKIKTNKCESNIYLLDNFLVKIPKTSLYDNNLIRSYYVGKILNNLRHIVPNFVCTLGLLSYKKQVMIAQEYIIGETLDSVLEKKKINFDDFLNIFIQILFALEIAQRHYRFCHYDLHLKNIIMKPIDKEYSYSVVIDTKRYDLVANKYIPIMIDFEFSSITMDNYTVGSYDFPHFGMMHYMIQGIDMYKFLFHAYSKTTDYIHKQIGTFFLFYGSRDPYKILVTPMDQFPKISKTYLKKVSFSHVATYTPLEMALWIFDIPEYKVNMNINDRDISCKFDIEFPKMTLKYIEKISGNILLDEKLIEEDLKMLSKYKTIQIPSELEVKNKVMSVINKEIGKYAPKISIDFVNQIKPYLQCVYMIRELRLESEYKSFLEEFCNSDHYNFYTKISLEVDKMKRWEETLILSTHHQLKTIRI